jgi:hypothetical protein
MSSKARPKKTKKTKTVKKSIDRIFPEISLEKETVIILVTVQGMSIKNAALTIKKSPVAVYEWFRDDIEFLAALKKQKEFMHEEIRSEFSNLPMIAYSAIRENLIGEEPDVKVALAFLKDSGNLVKTVDKENADDKAKRAAQALLSELESIVDEKE